MGGARRSRPPLSRLLVSVARRWTALALGLGLAIAGGAGGAGAEFTVAELMSELGRQAESAARFTETRHSTALREPLVTRGELRYKRPAYLERRMQSPFEQRYVIEDGRVTVERAGATRSIGLDSLPVLRVFIESIRATLAGDLAALARHYSVAFAGTRDDWTLSLAPSDPEVAAYVTSVRILGGAGRIRGMEVLEASGDRTVTRFAADAGGAPGRGRSE